MKPQSFYMQSKTTTDTKRSKLAFASTNAYVTQA